MAFSSFKTVRSVNMRNITPECRCGLVEDILPNDIFPVISVVVMSSQGNVRGPPRRAISVLSLVTKLSQSGGLIEEDHILRITLAR